eukprot:11969088-Alexandrium_andersonii.AAC.1
MCIRDRTTIRSASVISGPNGLRIWKCASLRAQFVISCLTSSNTASPFDRAWSSATASLSTRRTPLRRGVAPREGASDVGA